MADNQAIRAERATKDRVYFWCPGCNENHWINDAPGQWTFNGNFEMPTFSPSVLVTSGHYAPHGTGCWCKFYDDPEHNQTPVTSRFKCSVCHSFVTDGRIQFLSDCTHALAGQTVDLPPISHEQRLKAGVA